jgi:hypothetical protein
MKHRSLYGGGKENFFRGALNENFPGLWMVRGGNLFHSFLGLWNLLPGCIKSAVRGVVELRNSVEMFNHSITATAERITPDSVDCVSAQSEIRLDMPHYERTFKTSLTKTGVHISFFYYYFK